MTDVVKITITMPPSCLSPNHRSHWGKLSAAKKELRQTVANAVSYSYPELVDAHWPAADIQYAFFHRTVRIRDDDNYRSMMKSARDGLGPEKVTHRLNINPGCGLVADDTFISDAMPVLFSIDRKGPERVEITITKKEQPQ